MKRKLYIAFLCIISATLTGCGKQQNTEPVTSQTQESTQVVKESVSVQETEEVEKTTELPSTESEEPIQNANIDKLLGQWKVTEFAVTDNGRLSPIYIIKEHYYGRSIIIDEDKITLGMINWPDQLNSCTLPYECVRQWNESTEDYGIRNGCRDFWYKKIPDQMLEVYAFHVTYTNETKDYEVDYDEEYIVLEDGRVLCQYSTMYYYMEPYVQASSDIKLEELYGSWKVERLISYQDDWKGNHTDYEESFIDKPITNYTEENGANFYPLDYYNASFNLTEDSVTLCLEDGTTEQYAIHSFSSQTIDTVSYEEEKRIHDRLGVTNEDILVYIANIDGQTDEMLWNGDIVVIDENRIIVKLYQGWYMLVRE